LRLVIPQSVEAADFSGLPAGRADGFTGYQSYTNASSKVTCPVTVDPVPLEAICTKIVQSQQSPLAVDQLVLSRTRV